METNEHSKRGTSTRHPNLSPGWTGRAVVDDGSARTALPIAGYSIVEAPNIEGAKGLADGHPFLSDKTGKFSIEILEILPSPV
jgi:hypothetical protein